MKSRDYPGESGGSVETVETAARSPFCSSSMWQLEFSSEVGTVVGEELHGPAAASGTVGNLSSEATQVIKRGKHLGNKATIFYHNKACFLAS